uniref:J2L n=1 Tax=Tanapox virus TaxID=99000 RepID=Q9IGV1_9POXV|nr:J2L [Tanapox virus]
MSLLIFSLIFGNIIFLTIIEQLSKNLIFVNGGSSILTSTS